MGIIIIKNLCLICIMTPNYNPQQMTNTILNMFYTRMKCNNKHMFIIQIVLISLNLLIF